MTDLRALIIESEEEALVLEQLLRSGGYSLTVRRVDKPDDMVTALDSEQWDIVLADYQAPHFQGLSAVGILRERDTEVPFILVSEEIGEETAVLFMKAGVQEIVLKGNLQRLVPVVKSELKDAAAKRAYKESLRQSQESERSKAAAKLRQSEDLFRTLAGISPVGIFESDAAGRCIYVNPRWSEIVGLSFEEAMGDGWVDAVHPDDKNLVRCQWTDSVDSNQLFKSEHRFLHKDGTIVWVSEYARRTVDSDGEMTCYVGTLMDITDRKTVQCKLDKLSRAFKAVNKCVETLVHAEMRKSYLQIHANSHRRWWLFTSVDRNQEG